MAWSQKPSPEISHHAAIQASCIDSASAAQWLISSTAKICPSTAPSAIKSEKLAESAALASAIGALRRVRLRNLRRQRSGQALLVGLRVWWLQAVVQIYMVSVGRLQAGPLANMKLHLWQGVLHKPAALTKLRVMPAACSTKRGAVQQIIVPHTSCFQSSICLNLGSGAKWFEYR